MIDERHLELIHGEIDGENSAGESRELNRALDSSTECRALYEDMRRVADLLQEAKPVEPPRQLRAQIVGALANTLPHAQPRPASGRAGLGWLSMLRPRYAAAFAMGLLVAFGTVSVQRWAGDAELDVSQLTGTMTQHQALGQATPQRLVIDLEEISGSVVIRDQDPLLMVEFDLSSAGIVEVVAAFDGSDARFNGLAQRQGEALSVTAEGSRVSIKNQGEQQLALFLSNPRNGAMNLELGFYIDGRLIHQADLNHAGRQ